MRADRDAQVPGTGLGQVAEFTRIAVLGERDLDLDALTAPAPAGWAEVTRG